MPGIKSTSAASVPGTPYRGSRTGRNGNRSQHRGRGGDYTFYYSRSPSRPSGALSAVAPSHPLNTSMPADLFAPSRGSSTTSQRTVTTVARNGQVQKRHDWPSSHLNNGRRKGKWSQDDDVPSYWVEHLATLGMGKQHAIEWPTDGIRKLKQMERNGAIWAQPMVLRLGHTFIEVEDENGEIVEKFPLELISEPTAHQSKDPRDLYNNILLFIVREGRHRTAAGSEMHIFQCVRVSAAEVATDIKSFLSGRGSDIRGGRRNGNFTLKSAEMNGDIRMPIDANGSHSRGYLSGRGSMTDLSTTATGPRPLPPFDPDADHYRSPRVVYSKEIRPGNYPGFTSGSVYYPGPTANRLHHDESDSDISEVFERDVNTLNHCFDEIERFVARIQSCAHAQRELDAIRRSQRKPMLASDRNLAIRAQLPTELEFVDAFQKFKLSFNLLAKLRNHIHEPNAPELLHFLFTPLTVILDAARWGIGDPVAPRVISPLITLEARELMAHCLTSKESDVWLTLGDAWRIPEEEWAPRPMPGPYYPVFYDGFIPYGPADHRNPAGVPSSSVGGSGDTPTTIRRHRTGSRSSSRHGSTSDVTTLLDIDKLQLEKERIDFEKQKLEDRERRIRDEERKMQAERRRLHEEKRRFLEDAEKQSELSFAASEMPSRDHRSRAAARRHGGRSPGATSSSPRRTRSYSGSQLSPIHISSPSSGALNGGGGDRGASSPHGRAHTPVVPAEQSPRQRVYLDELIARGAKIVQAQHDRTGSNQKELTIYKGEYLEVLDNRKNWWQCRNVNLRVGFVPCTIVTPVTSPLSPRRHANTSSNPWIEPSLPKDNQLGKQLPQNHAEPRIVTNPITTSQHNHQPSTSSSAFSKDSRASPVRKHRPSGPQPSQKMGQNMGKKGEFRYF